MSSQAVVPIRQQEAASPPEAYELALVSGDLEKLTPADRVTYYRNVCSSLGLNPLTQPFDYIRLNNKLRLYALKNATDQLRDLRKVSITRLEREVIGDLYVVTAYARAADGREDSDFGAVTVKGLTGDNLANAMLRCVTKAKRRVTLSICGLGWLDETEAETIPTARRAVVDTSTGEVIEDQPRITAPKATATVATLGTDADGEEIPPHPLAVRAEDEVEGRLFRDGVPLWAYDGLVGTALETTRGWALQSEGLCPEHSKPFYLLAGKDQWEHGRGADLCRWADVRPDDAELAPS